MGAPRIPATPEAAETVRVILDTVPTEEAMGQNGCARFGTIDIH